MMKSKKFIDRQLSGMKNKEIFSTQNLPSISDSDTKIYSSGQLKTDKRYLKIRPSFSPRVEKIRKEVNLRWDGVLIKS